NSFCLKQSAHSAQSAPEYYVHHLARSTNHRHNRPGSKHTRATFHPSNRPDKLGYLLQYVALDYDAGFLIPKTVRPEIPHQNVPDDAAPQYRPTWDQPLKQLLKHSEFLFL